MKGKAEADSNEYGEFGFRYDLRDSANLLNLKSCFISKFYFSLKAESK